MNKSVLLIILILFGIQVSGQDSVDVTFHYFPKENFSSVHIPGEFNGWNPSSSGTRMTYNPVDNSWHKKIRLRVGGPSPLPGSNSIPGAYQYKFHNGSDWLQDPLNPLINTADHDNSYLYINNPTIHLLLPNNMPAYGVVRTRTPIISAYLFPATSSEVDPESITLTIGDSVYANLSSYFDRATGKVEFKVPFSMGDGEHELQVTAAVHGGESVSMNTTFVLQGDLVQFSTLPAVTRKLTWRIQGIVNNDDGSLNTSLKSALLSRPDTTWKISVNEGRVDTTIQLLTGKNEFTLTINDGETNVSSNVLTIENREYRKPRAEIQMFKGGDLMIFSAGSSTDPQGGGLVFSWHESPENPQLIGLEGETDLQVNRPLPTAPGEYFVTLEVMDDEGLIDAVTRYFTIGQDGIDVKVADLADNPEWVKNSRIYLLFFKAFTPEGTIAAAIPKLNYIKKMGFNTIWVLPVMEIPGNVDNQINIGYYIEDMMQVESSYGTAEDYKAFVNAAHANGLKVIQDVTPNHTGKVHTFAKEAKLYGNLSQYWSYYQTQYLPHGTKGNNGLGDCTTPEGIYHYCGFSDALLNWDWRDVDAREYMIGVYEHWIREYNIDGYRFDVYWGPSRKYGEASMGVPVREALKRIKPDIMLLGEDDGVGVGTEYLYADQGGGLDVSYDFQTYFGAVRDFGFNSTAINTLHERLNNAGFHPGENSYYLRFLESQDEDRISYKYNSFEKTMPVATAIFMAPGIPLLYNGQEVGWGRGMGNPGEPDLNDRRRGIIDWDFAGRAVLTPHYQKLAQIRSQFPAFSQHRKDSNSDGWVNASDESDFDRVSTGNGLVYAYLRPYAGSNGLVVMNFSASPQIATLELNQANLRLQTDANIHWLNNLYQGMSEVIPKDTLQGLQVELPPYGTAIYTISDMEEMVHIPNLNVSTALNVPEQLPRESTLHRVYPNPFNPTATITFSLLNAGPVTLKVYDLGGRVVWTGLKAEYTSSGTHEIQWSGINDEGETVSSGVYLVELEVSGNTGVQKVTLLR